MIHLALSLIPILIIDMINPVLLGGTIFSLGSKQPTRNTLAVLFTFLITYLIAGLLIAIGLELIEGSFKLPRYFDYILELIVAALLLYMAWKQHKEGDTHPEKKLKQNPDLSFKGAALLGLQINMVGLPFAIPYLAAIDQVLKAEASIYATLLLLLLYNILYILPYSLLLLIPTENTHIFKTINNWMHRITEKWLPILFFLLALLLIEDAVSFLLGYREYSFMELL